MANWSQLPTELLEEIARRLESSTYILRFRSVCSSWRSSVSPRPRSPPGRFPFLPNDGISDTSWGFHLSKRTVFLLGPPPNPDPPNRDLWLVKVEDDAPTRMHLLNPFSRFQIKPLPENFPKVLDISQFRVFELGQEFVLHYMLFRPFGNSLGDAGNLHMEKVVFKFLDSDSSNFVLLTIHVSGKLAMYRSGDKRWNIIHEMPSPYDDVILFAGDFYAVDSTGRAVLVGLSSSNVGLVARPVFGGGKKFLVESSGELLMVDIYLSMAASTEVDMGGQNYDAFEQFDLCMGERTVRFKVFKLDREEKKWVEVNSLDDRVLFLGDDCTFSASASDLSCCRNCIFFTDNFFYTDGEEDVVFRGRDIGVYDIGVYDMENGSIAAFADNSEYSKLFWPPPDWILLSTSGATSTDSTEASQVQAQFEELNL